MNPTKNWGEFMCSGRVAVPAPIVTLVVLSKKGLH